jgi:hypothetical protein
MLCDFCYDKSFFAIQGFDQDSIISCSSIEIKGTSTLHYVLNFYFNGGLSGRCEGAASERSAVVTDF